MGIEVYGLRVLSTYEDTIVDGDGLRYAIYLEGCRHRCPHCHNPESWDSRGGDLLDEARLRGIIDAIRGNDLLDGVTVSGGDPFFNPMGLAELLRAIREGTGLSIWCYTGYTLEEIAKRPALRAPLRYIDVLVDGRYVHALADPTLCFRGSSNQRIIRNPYLCLGSLGGGTGLATGE